MIEEIIYYQEAEHEAFFNFSKNCYLHHIVLENQLAIIISRAERI